MTAPWSIRKKIPWPGYGAHTEVARAIADGRLKRQSCFICGWCYGEAHHPDYDKPLDVVFLCQKHHLRFHSRLKRQFLQTNRYRYTIAFHDQVLSDLRREYIEPELLLISTKPAEVAQ